MGMFDCYAQLNRMAFGEIEPMDMMDPNPSVAALAMQMQDLYTTNPVVELLLYVLNDKCMSSCMSSVLRVLEPDGSISTTYVLGVMQYITENMVLLGKTEIESDISFCDGVFYLNEEPTVAEVRTALEIYHGVHPLVEKVKSMVAEVESANYLNVNQCMDLLNLDFKISSMAGFLRAMGIQYVDNREWDGAIVGYVASCCSYRILTENGFYELKAGFLEGSTFLGCNSEYMSEQECFVALDRLGMLSM